MAKGDFFIKLFIDDWLNDPCLRALKRENRDTWLTVCLLMHREGVYKFEGTSEVLARKFLLTLEEFNNFLEDLLLSDTADIFCDGQQMSRAHVTQMSRYVTKKVRIFTVMSRRYHKDAKIKEQNRLRKQKQRDRDAVTPKSHESHNTIVTSYKLQEEKKKKNETPLPLESQPAVIHFTEVFGSPGLSFSKQIANHVRDLDVWIKLLRDKSVYADDPKKRKSVPTWILRAYDEAVGVKAKLNGTHGGPTARDFATDAKRQEEEFLREKGLI